MPIAEAVTRRALHINGMPDETFVEPGFAPDVLEALRGARPHDRADRAAHVGQFDRRSRRMALSAPPTPARAARWRRDISAHTKHAISANLLATG